MLKAGRVCGRQMHHAHGVFDRDKSSGSISVRPKHGRIGACLPVTKWLRLSFVEICTVKSILRKPWATSSVSDIAERMFPPRAINKRTESLRAASTNCTVSSRSLKKSRLPLHRPPGIFLGMMIDADGAVTLPLECLVRASACSGSSKMSAGQQDIAGFLNRGHHRCCVMPMAQMIRFSMSDPLTEFSDAFWESPHATSSQSSASCATSSHPCRCSASMKARSSWSSSSSTFEMP